MHGYARPESLDEAIALLAHGPRVLLAGGTDLYAATEAPALSGPVLDLTRMRELQGIRQTADGGLEIGAATTWAEIARADLPPSLAGLVSAAREVGGRQIQNTGTIGGNLCNASPAADGVPPLLTLDAQVVLHGPEGARRLPLAAFLRGPRQTARLPSEILTAICIPGPALAGRSVFLKLGARAHLVISIVMVAVRLEADAGRVARAAIAVGACSGVARRLPDVEARLCGLPLAEAASAVDRAEVAGALAPLDDHRASAEYRREAAGELVARAVAAVAAEGTQ